MSFSVGISLAVLAVLNSAALPQGSVSSDILPQAQTVREYVEEYFADAPIMAAVAECESHFKQFDKDGSVHRGVVNTKDVGVMQINEFYHAKTAEKLGLDIYTIQGNVAYARYLYEKQGTAPWISSKPCWKHSDAHLALAAKN
ncbi:MAG: hypothetical protein AAB449_01850 [Patescibacteria group bacterium]